MHDIARIRHDKEDILFEPLNYDWWNDKHLKGSGLKVVEIDESTNLIAGTSSELKTYLAAHAHDPRLFWGRTKLTPITAA